MIRRIQVKGFRALRYVNIGLEDFQVLVGPNASGKSTFFDAINFVRDIMNVGIERSVFGDLRVSVPQRALDWFDISWMRNGEDIEILLWVEIPADVISSTDTPYRYCCYELALTFGPHLSLRNETLWLSPSSTFPGKGDDRGRQMV